MKLSLVSIVVLLVNSVCHAGDTDNSTGVKPFVRRIVQSLIDGKNIISFEVADTVFAIDNGETLSKDDLKRAWPEFCKLALKKKVSIENFFSGIDLQIQPVFSNKRIMTNKRLMKVYKHQKGDMYCDASHVKEGVTNFIGYDKAFTYIFRKVNSNWVLIGIGG